MMAPVERAKKPTCVYWSEVGKWTPTSSLLRFGKLPSGWRLMPVHAFVTQIDNKERVQPDAEYRMAGLKWYGEGIFHRETVHGKEQSANYLYPLVPGAVIYNRLFAWKESFAVVPKAFAGFYVSNEFPQFAIDSAVALPEYVYLLFTSKRIIKAVNAASIGSAAISRNRFRESDFLGFKVPIPPLPLQQEVKAYWEDAQRVRELADQAQKDLIAKLHLHLVKKTHAFDQATSSRMFVANYARTQQWDLKAGRAAAFVSQNPDFVRLGDYAVECCELVRAWDEPEHQWPIYGVNNKEGVFLSTHQKGDQFNAPYKRIEENWFFHNPTRANVGSLGIVPEVPEDAITSPEYQVWRLTGGYLPEFMAIMIRTDYFLALVAFNRVGGVKQRMYYANLAEIRLPMVAHEVQQHYVLEHMEILKRIWQAEVTIRERKREIEEMLLGIRPIKGI